MGAEGLLGSAKSVLERAEYFTARSLDVTTVEAPSRSDELLVGAVRALGPERFEAAVVEYSVYPRTVETLRRAGVRVVVRAHQAESLHALDHARARARLLPARARMRELARGAVFAAGRFRADVASARKASAILSITAWERDRYWARLGGESKALDAPYYHPASVRLSRGPKRDLCIAFGSPVPSPSPIVTDAVRGFSRAVQRLGRRHAWDFAVTGTPAVSLPPPIRALGAVEDPYRILGEAKALAVLSDLGYGFKTKILEAALAGTWALVTPAVFRRLPAEVAPFAIPVDVRDPRSFEAALDAASKGPPSAPDPNPTLRARAFAAMDRALRIAG